MFPFDQPPATLFYFGWYWLTLVLHVVPMSYVLAGSAYLAVVALGEVVVGPRPVLRRLANYVRDWIPFALGVAITFGVAPLVFLQILYRKPFYTANLLLFHRWMAILPVLIVSFYLLYLQKSARFHQWPAALRAGISLGIAGCFAFVAWSWTENHLLSLQSQQVWTELYASGRWFFINAELFPRLAVWYLGAFPIWATVVAWQVWTDRPPTDARSNASAADRDATAVRTLAAVALSTLVGVGGAMVVYWARLSAEQAMTFSRANMIYPATACAALAVQAALWGYAWIAKRQSWATLLLLSGSVVTAAAAATITRELRRTAAIDMAALMTRHADTFRVAGFYAFVIFGILNLGLIAMIGLILRNGLRKADKG
jgi:hypothetical protein